MSYTDQVLNIRWMTDSNKTLLFKTFWHNLGHGIYSKHGRRRNSNNNNVSTYDCCSVLLMLILTLINANIDLFNIGLLDHFSKCWENKNYASIRFLHCRCIVCFSCSALHPLFTVYRFIKTNFILHYSSCFSFSPSLS